jgi:hypothetical protein
MPVLGVAMSLLVFVFVILVDNVFARLKWQTAIRSAWVVAAVLGFGNILVLSLFNSGILTMHFRNMTVVQTNQSLVFVLLLGICAILLVFVVLKSRQCSQVLLSGGSRATFLEENQQQNGETIMDYNKLSKFILAFGLVLVCIGAFNFLSNLPVSASQTPGSSENTVAGMAARADQMMNGMETQAQNENRSIKRGGAIKVIGVGVIIIFAAVAVMQSTRKQKSNDALKG